MMNQIPGREQEVQKIIKILADHHPVNLCITAPYGAGKTFLVHLIISELKNNTKIGYIKFNAWQYDYWDNPIQALLDSISPAALNRSEPQFIENYAKLKSKSHFLSKAFAKVFNGLKQMAPSAIGWTLSSLLAISAAHHGCVINAEQLNEFNKVISKFFEGSMASADNEDKVTASKQAIKEENSLQESIEQFRKALYDYLQPYDKFYVFIDELDRCKPDFTISLLELIKHVIFNKEELTGDEDNKQSTTSLQKISYIFTVDKNQLIESVKHTYGQGIDAGGYLRRFFTLTYPLIQSHDKTEFCAAYINKNPKLQQLGIIITPCVNYVRLEPRNIEKLIYIINSAIEVENKLFNFKSDGDGTNTFIVDDDGKEKLLNLWYLRFVYIFFVALKLKNLNDYLFLTDIDKVRESFNNTDIVIKIHAKLRPYIQDANFFKKVSIFFQSYNNLKASYDALRFKPNLGEILGRYFTSIQPIDNYAPCFIHFISVSIDNLDFL